MRQAPQGRSDLQDSSKQNTFTALALDRAFRRRRDEAWIRDRLKDRSTRFLLTRGPKVLLADTSPPRPIWLRPEEAGEHLRQAESVVLLGKHGRYTYFAVGLPFSDDASASGPMTSGVFRDLQAVASLLDDETAALLAYGKAMAHYHHHHRFCGTCGSPTTSQEGGHLRRCTSDQCGQLDFPRTDPAIIVLVSSDERCLLGRQPTWPENLYSIIAGFVEPGESLEAAVTREVWEETGVRVKDVTYLSSQPWPFPRSLMVGFTATAETTTLRLTDGELQEARWLSRQDIARELRQGRLQLPSSISISHRLIEMWYDAEGSVSLGDVLKRA